MSFKIKDNFNITKNCEVVKDKVWVEKQTLYIIDGDEQYKFTPQGEWFIKTPLTDGYIPLGLGALPGCVIKFENVIDENEFYNIFEECNEERA